MAKTLKPHIVLFVEGDTDKVFFEALLVYYRTTSTTPINSCEVCDLQGVSRYSTKVMGKLENEILPNVRKKGFVVKAVCCSYDTDVFEFAERPVVDWNKVKRNIKCLGITHFCQIEVKSSIEDWLLADKEGISKFLKLKTIPPISGNSGNQKMMDFFRKAKRVYVKGRSVLEFISFLDLSKIRSTFKEPLSEFEVLLNVTLG